MTHIVFLSAGVCVSVVLLVDYAGACPSATEASLQAGVACSLMWVSCLLVLRCVINAHLSV